MSGETSIILVLLALGAILGLVCALLLARGGHSSWNVGAALLMAASSGYSWWRAETATGGHLPGLGWAILALGILVVLGAILLGWLIGALLRWRKMRRQDVLPAPQP